MAGFYPDKVRELFSIPEGFDPVTVIAVGYPGDPSKLPDEIRARHEAVKNRKPLQEFVFSSNWENAAFKWSEPEGNPEE
jgi:nitroreductase